MGKIQEGKGGGGVVQYFNSPRSLILMCVERGKAGGNFAALASQRANELHQNILREKKKTKQGQKSRYQETGVPGNTHKSQISSPAGRKNMTVPEELFGIYY